MSLHWIVRHITNQNSCFNKRDLMQQHLHLFSSMFQRLQSQWIILHLTTNTNVNVILSFWDDLIQVPYEKKKKNHGWVLKINPAWGRVLLSSTLGRYYNFNDLPRIFHTLCFFWRKTRQPIEVLHSPWNV